MPATGDGSSASTLSVEISTMPSSTSTVSPTCLSHSRTVPSETDSPICGTVTSTTSPVAVAGARRCRRRPDVADRVGGRVVLDLGVGAVLGLLDGGLVGRAQAVVGRASLPPMPPVAFAVGRAGAPPLPETSISPSTVPVGTVSSGWT